ncbi:MAG TPA: ATP-binding protein [Candidatus Dormibacteraeota bacterium]|nr:ATP-binding protein [Candidatus Dormibacteraeota bacterium]
MTAQQESTWASEGGVHVVELRIPCRPEFVSVARLAVAGIANRLHFTVEEIEDVKLAVAEACTSAIQRSPGAKEIAIVCEVAPEELRIVVRDRGVHDLDSPETAELGSGGLGVFLIRSLMDQVEFHSNEREGTVLRMVKRAGGAG